MGLNHCIKGKNYPKPLLQHNWKATEGVLEGGQQGCGNISTSCLKKELECSVFKAKVLVSNTHYFTCDNMPNSQLQR